MEKDRLRRYVAGICLILSPLAGLAAWITHPGLAKDEFDQLTALASATTRADWAIGLGMLSIALGVFATLGLIHLLRERGSVVGYVGGGLTLLGLVAIAINGGVQSAAVELSRSGVTSDNVVVYRDILASPMGIVMIAGGIVLAGGLVVLSAVLYQARVVPEPSAMLLAAFAVAQAVGFMLFSTATIAGAFVAATVALVPIGYRLITESDSEWEHAPRMHWYRPAST